LPFEFPFESAISDLSSVEVSEIGIDSHLCPERAGKAAIGDGALEALEPLARVGASSGLVCARRQLAFVRDEPDEL
jgi:hypothetical protein